MTRAALIVLASLVCLALAVGLWLVPEEWGPVEILFLGPGIATCVVAAVSLIAISFWTFQVARGKQDSGVEL